MLQATIGRGKSTLNRVETHRFNYLTNSFYTCSFVSSKNATAFFGEKIKCPIIFFVSRHQCCLPVHYIGALAENICTLLQATLTASRFHPYQYLIPVASVADTDTEFSGKQIRNLPITLCNNWRYEYTYTYEVGLHLRGKPTPMRSVQGIAAPMKYIYDVKLHLRGTSTPSVQAPSTPSNTASSTSIGGHLLRYP